MALKNKTHDVQGIALVQRSSKRAVRTENEQERLSAAPGALERIVIKEPATLRPADIMTLQRTVGNRAVQRMLSNQLHAKLPSSTPAGTIQRQTEEEEPLQGKFERAPRTENRTGLPDRLKAGIEDLSGFSLDDVKVHYNSTKPAEVQALAYTQGNEIHVAPGQEKHLPHEAWHVVQQKQQRVKPTLQAKGFPINDEQHLETEADALGAQALSSVVTVAQRKEIGASYPSRPGSSPSPNSMSGVMQRQTIEGLNQAHIKPWQHGDFKTVGWAKKSLRVTEQQYFTTNHIRDDVADATAKQSLISRAKTRTRNTIYKKSDFKTAKESIEGEYWIKQGRNRVERAQKLAMNVDVKTVASKSGTWAGGGQRKNASDTDRGNIANYGATAQFNDSKVTSKLTRGGTLELYHVVGQA
jgi:hypothetical protein